MRLTIERGLDIDDVLYGYAIQIEWSWQGFYLYPTGFTRQSQMSALERVGFPTIYSTLGNLEILAIASKDEPDATVCMLFNLPDE